MDRKYVLTALGYALVGLLLGIHMAMSENHGQRITHAHIMLLGFVVSFIYAVIHKLWLGGGSSRLVAAQYYCHQVGTAVLLLGLFLLYGGHVAGEVIGPVLGVASIVVLAGLVLMKVLYIKSTKSA